MDYQLEEEEEGEFLREGGNAGNEVEGKGEGGEQAAQIPPNLAEVAKGDDLRLSEIKKRHKKILDEARKAQNLEVESEEVRIPFFIPEASTNC